MNPADGDTGDPERIDGVLLSLVRGLTSRVDRRSGLLLLLPLHLFVSVAQCFLLPFLLVLCCADGVLEASESSGVSVSSGVLACGAENGFQDMRGNQKQMMKQNCHVLMFCQCLNVTQSSDHTTNLITGHVVPPRVLSTALVPQFVIWRGNRGPMDFCEIWRFEASLFGERKRRVWRPK